ncbi:TonB-dependent receptor [Ramlibacter terrae]|uniref:TonB-dependent receptor n=1 Tax=Ramlibacter terrae TaxID=2732511 RepID=A0ABX6P1C6_9BURK|nr:TonB-dependent receptor [Ramlibacter terrae]
MRTRSIMLPALLAQAFAAGAQGVPDDAGSERQLDPMTVTARRSIEQRFFAAGSLVVVDRQDIENLGAFSVADVLRQLPGVVVTTSGDGSVEIRMRGMDRNATQLLVDGQRVSGGRSQLPLDQLPSELIERIEVVRAPTAEFSGATGGTLNIICCGRRRSSARRCCASPTTTCGGATRRSRSSRPAGRSAASRRSRRRARRRCSPRAYFVALASTGYILGSQVHRTVIESTGTTETDASPRFRRHELSLVPRLSGRLGPLDQLALRGTFSNNQIDGQNDTTGAVTATGGAPAPFATAEVHSYDRSYAQGAADWTHRFGGSKLETTLSASRARESLERNGSSVGGAGPAVPIYAFDDDRQEETWSLSTKLTGTRSPLLWTLGAQAERRTMDVRNQNGAVRLDLDAVLDRHVLWGQNEWEVFSGSTLTAGLRGETLQIRSRSGAATLVDRRDSFLQPSLHLRTPLSPDLQFRANAARITRNPRIWDLLDRSIVAQGRNNINNPDYRGNPALRPETAWTLDTGFERRLPQDGQGGINLFVRRTSDTVAAVTRFSGGRWVEQRVNIGDAIVWGLELDAKTGLAWLGLPRDWTLAANAGLLQSRMTSGVNEGERIPGQPRYTASITIAKPIRRGPGGLFGGGTLSLTGPADWRRRPASTAATARAPCWTCTSASWCAAGAIGASACSTSAMRGTSAAAATRTPPAAAQSSSVMTLTPRLYLTVGTSF